MQLQHTFTVPIGIDEAWTAFNDLEGIAPCFPGAVITSVDGDEFTGTAKVKLGPISLMYTGKGSWTSRDAQAYRAVIEAQGKDKRGNGTAGAVITAHLEPAGDGTKVVVDTELKITGRPAQFGRGVIQDVGGKILDQFATCLSQRLGQPEAAEAVAPEGEDPTPPDVRADEAARARTSEAVPAAPVPAAPVPATPVPTPAPPATPAAAPTARPVPEPEPAELDLGNVVGPVLLQRFGPIAAAVVVTAVITWVVARRRS